MHAIIACGGRSFPQTGLISGVSGRQRVYPRIHGAIWAEVGPEISSDIVTVRSTGGR